MTRNIDTRIRRFFADYAVASLGGDSAAVAAAYAATYIETGPTAVASFTVDKAYQRELAKKSDMMTTQFGLSALDIDIEDIREMAPQHYAVRAGWTMSFHPPGQKPVTSRFQISYVVRVAEAVVILLAISHEDEAAVMKRDGLL